MAKEYVIQGFYPGYGWVDVSAYDNKAEAQDDLRAYQENEPEYAHRLVTRDE